MNCTRSSVDCIRKAQGSPIPRRWREPPGSCPARGQHVAAALPRRRVPHGSGDDALVAAEAPPRGEPEPPPRRLRGPGRRAARHPREGMRDAAPLEGVAKGSQHPADRGGPGGAAPQGVILPRLPVLPRREDPLHLEEQPVHLAPQGDPAAAEATATRAHRGLSGGAALHGAVHVSDRRGSPRSPLLIIFFWQNPCPQCHHSRDLLAWMVGAGTRGDLELRAATSIHRMPRRSGGVSRALPYSYHDTTHRRRRFCVCHQPRPRYSAVPRRCALRTAF